MDISTRSASQIGRDIARGATDPVALAEAYLDAIAAHPHSGRIYARLCPGRARAEAKAARQRAQDGVRRGLLDGVALSWKDNIDSAGTATEAGSRLLAGRMPAGDAEGLARATLAGMVCLGKTHMTELAFSGLGINPRTATPPNAHDPARVPGGSSSGAAVSVALGLAAAAIGSDTGGSIRVPAAWNGLVGFKPTHGATPSEGVVPLCTSFDVIGPIARSVEDCAEIFALLSATRPADLRGAMTGGLRLAVLDDLPFRDADAEVVTYFDETLTKLAAKGAKITRLSPTTADEAMALAPALFAPEAYGIWRDVIEADPEAMHPPILERFRGGASVSGPEFVAAWRKLHSLRARWDAEMAGFDAVILPTVPIMPPLLKTLETDMDAFTHANLLCLRNTRIANLMGLPAVSLPTGRAGIGMMAMGRAGHDRALLVVAAALETALTDGSAAR